MVVIPIHSQLDIDELMVIITDVVVVVVVVVAKSNHLPLQLVVVFVV